MNLAKPILEQHAEHIEWLNKLSFYKDDPLLKIRWLPIIEKYRIIQLIAKK